MHSCFVIAASVAGLLVSACSSTPSGNAAELFSSQVDGKPTPAQVPSEGAPPGSADGAGVPSSSDGASHGGGGGTNDSTPPNGLDEGGQGGEGTVGAPALSTPEGADERCDFSLTGTVFSGNGNQLDGDALKVDGFSNRLSGERLIVFGHNNRVGGKDVCVIANNVEANNESGHVTLSAGGMCNRMSCDNVSCGDKTFNACLDGECLTACNGSGTTRMGRTYSYEFPKSGGFIAKVADSQIVMR